MVLSGPTLYFFKNELEKKKGKKPVLFMTLDGKDLAQQFEHTKKKFIIVVGNDIEK